MRRLRTEVQQNPLARKRRAGQFRALAERILIINPNSSISCTDGIAEAVEGFRAPGQALAAVLAGRAMAGLRIAAE